MGKEISQIEIKLLSDNPQGLISEIQDLIDIIISKFIKSGKFIRDDRDDVKQIIIEELLKKIPKIRKQFQGKSLLRTYLATVINNICFEILRKQKKKNVVNELQKNPVYEDDGISSESLLIIEEEIKRLDRIFALYHNKRNKLILCLKLRYRIPFSYHDFLNYCQEVSDGEFKKFRSDIEPFLKTSDLEIYHSLIPVFNKYEEKNNSADSLRKWIKFKINELINLLNGTPPTSNYTEETLQILFEKYIMNKINS